MLFLLRLKTFSTLTINCPMPQDVIVWFAINFACSCVFAYHLVPKKLDLCENVGVSSSSWYWINKVTKSANNKTMTGRQAPAADAQNMPIKSRSFSNPFVNINCKSKWHRVSSAFLNVTQSGLTFWQRQQVSSPRPAVFGRSLESSSRDNLSFAIFTNIMKHSFVLISYFCQQMFQNS